MFGEHTIYHFLLFHKNLDLDVPEGRVACIFCSLNALFMFHEHDIITNMKVGKGTYTWINGTLDTFEGRSSSPG